jgi:hypothetical protein
MSAAGCEPTSFSSAAGQPASGAYGHVVVTEDLATQANSGQSPRWQHIALGHCHALRLAFNKLHSAGETQ